MHQEKINFVGNSCLLCGLEIPIRENDLVCKRAPLENIKNNAKLPDTFKYEDNNFASAGEGELE